MKKILSVILALACLFSVCAVATACGGSKEKTAYELYTEAADKLEKNGTNYEMDAVTKMAMKSGETNLGSSESTTSMVVNGNNLYTKSVAEDYTAEIWYVDGTMYMNAAGEKYKTEISLEEFTEDYLGTGTSTEIIELEKSLFDNVEIKTEDGGKYIEFALTSEQLLSFLGSDLESLGAESLSDVKYVVHFGSDNSIKSVDIVFSMVASGISVDMDMSMTFKNVGKASAVTAPSDASSYSDMDDLG